MCCIVAENGDALLASLYAWKSTQEYGDALRASLYARKNAQEYGDNMLSDFDLEGKNKIQKALYYLKNYGLSYTLKKTLKKLGLFVSEESEYMVWCRKNSASKEELRAQSNDSLSRRFSFVIAAEKKTDFYKAGWTKQTCSRISFAEITEETKPEDLLSGYDADYFVFCGKEIHVQPEYLYEIAKAAAGDVFVPVSRIRRKNENAPDLFYTDEDNRNGKKRSRPFFKPDADLQMLLNFPYLGRCFVLKRSLLERLALKGEQTVLWGNDGYDLSLKAFRCAEHIFHIPKTLFSNVVPKEELYSFIRGRSRKNGRCLERYLAEEGLSGKVIKSDVPGFFHVEWEIKEEPLVSIIIPNKDHIDDLMLCLNSLEKSDYKNYEVIIAENNSEDPETFALYERLMAEDNRIHTVKWEGGFNYSAINNFAAKTAKGELFLFLNNDTEFIGKTALRQLAASVLKPGVGAAGAMLYYGDSTIQHGGVIIGMGGFAAHALWSLTDRDEKYYPFSLCEREVSAVTGACLMVRRSVFEEVGGMEEEFVVALNDVDFCMKVRAAGYRIIWNPYAKLYHYESKSRGYEDTMEKQARFQNEIERFQKKWEKEIKEGDPFYNPNLTLHRADYSMDI